jgi:Ca-activated chloride channel family protein
MLVLLCGGAAWSGCDNAESAKEDRAVASAQSKTAASDDEAGGQGQRAEADAKNMDGDMPIMAEPEPMPEAIAEVDEEAPAEPAAASAADGLSLAPSAKKRPMRKSGGAAKGMARPGKSRGKKKISIGSGSDPLSGLMAERAKPKPMSPPPPDADKDPAAGEGYDHVQENAFIAVADDPRSTFSIDVDTASYSNVRRFLDGGNMPPPEAVRVEEMINYFSYNYESPLGSDPFSINTEVSGTPWNDETLLVSVGLQGQRIDMSEVGARNLVFLLDVSGSMSSPDKLPLLKQGLGMLVNNLRDNDRVSIVVYAGASGVVLEPTMGNDKPRIMEALERLQAGGSTNGGEGIKLAYKMAAKHFEKGGVNRVILATDGDFNVGATNRTELLELIEDKRKSGVFLSVLGFGTGNMQDSTMEMLADKGNGNYAYIDSKAEARKVLVEEAGGTLVTIAKDVKLQVEFNPAEVESYRLIGYENRKLAQADFNDDTKDAGEIGAGHSVTALYEVKPKGSSSKSATDKLKYQDDAKLTEAAKSGEMLTVKIRYKKPDGNKSKLISLPVTGDDRGLRNTSKDYRFSAAVAQFAMILRHSKYKGDATYDDVLKLAGESLGADPHGHRKAFLDLVKKAKRIDKGNGALARKQ